MRKIILDVAVTLDGFIEGPNGEIDWIVDDGETDFGDVLTDILHGIDTIFYGRISYEKWGNYSPEGDVSQKLKAAYELLHSKNKYVFSTTKSGNGKATFIHSDIKGNVEQILQSPGENIWLYGGGKLLTSFINLGLVDVFRLAVQPVILGKGLPLFANIEQRVNLQLIEATTTKSGMLLLKYAADKNKK